MKIKLHIVPPNHPKLRYQHEMVCLAEGFRALGIEFYGTDDYWMEPDRRSYLILKSPSQYNSDVNIYNTYYFNAFPEAIERVDYAKVNILIDREDGLYGEYCNAKYKRFNLILRTHFNGNINYGYYHSNIQPWAFGLSERIINTIDEEQQAAVVDRAFISYRLSHDLRSKAVEQLTPVLSKKYQVFNSITNGFQVMNPNSFSATDKSYWEQSGHRHDPAYYKLLNSSLLTLAFGGFTHIRPFATNRLVKQMQHLYKFRSAALRLLKLDDSKCYFIDQFDSWRLWESFYSNTCPIHMDFEHWNWVLPVMPVNKVHYWGVSAFKFRESAEELLSLDKDTLLAIARAGKQWSLDNYSPRAIALRFVDMINKI